MRVVKVCEGAPYSITIEGTYGIRFTYDELKEIFNDDYEIEEVLDKTFIIKYVAGVECSYQFFELNEDFLEETIDIESSACLKYIKNSNLPIKGLSLEQIDKLLMMCGDQQGVSKWVSYEDEEL